MSTISQSPAEDAKKLARKLTKKVDTKVGPDLSFITDMALGGASGVIAKTACAPLERVKIVLQTAKTSSGMGMLGTGRSLISDQGIASLWRGNLTNCSRYFPTQAINFACKEKYQNLLVPPRENGFAPWFAGYLAAGGLAGATSLTVVYPLEFAYTRLAADTGAKKQFTGMTDVVKQITAKEGIKGLYRGYGPSVAGIIIYRAGYFGFYDAGKQMLGLDGTNASFILKFGLAMAVDISAAVIAYPIDTVRRRLMMQSGAATQEFTTARGAVKHIYGLEGMAGFYKGCGANNVRAISSALVLVTYDEVKQAFNPKN